MNSLCIFKFCFSMHFNSSWTEMSFIDMMTNSLLEIWNLVWTKRQTGQATTENSPFTLLYLGIFPFSLACVAGGISCVRAFALVAKPWTRVAKPWEDWWRVQLNSRLPKFVGFFELCVHQCTRISDWLRIPKRQSNVNLYLSSFPGEKVCFHAQICKMENAKKCREAALDSLNIPWNSRKIIQMEEQERAVKSCYGKF